MKKKDYLKYWTDKMNGDKRLIVKSFSWEVIAFIFTAILSFLLFGINETTILFNATLILGKSVGLYYWLKLWKKISYGKKE